MKRRRLRSIGILPLALLMGCGVAACSDDDDNLPEVPLQTGAPMQVMAVFDPYELGDLGLADNLLRGLFTIPQTDSLTGAPRIDVSYVSLTSKQQTADRMQQWLTHREDLFTPGHTYSRRLLILTRPDMLLWTPMDSLHADDRVLLIDADSTMLDEPRLAAIRDRVHIINISAAAAVRKFYAKMQQLDDTFQLDLFANTAYLQWYENVVEQDSVLLTLDELGNETEVLAVDSLGENGMSSYYQYAVQMGYDYASLFNKYFATYNGSAIVNMGVANAGFSSYMLTHSHECFVVYIDRQEHGSAGQPTVCRQFGKAAADFVEAWSAGQPLPAVQWHGEWDGYCEDNIDRALGF